MLITERVLAKNIHAVKQLVIPFFQKLPCAVLLSAVAPLSLTGLTALGTDAPTPQTVSSRNIRQIAPGIWRIRVGKPEKFTPLYFQTFPPRVEGLKKLPPAGELPIRPDEIGFQITGRGCAIELPLNHDEGIYGFGLNTRLFDMTKVKNGTGRKVMLKPTDHPENDLGESHAPAPFYVSTHGYGVFVDSARYVSFYTGNITTRDGKQTMLVDVPSAPGVDIYLFAGPETSDAIRRFNLFCGGGCVPPLWGLGWTYRGNGTFNADDTIALAQQFRADHMPFDVWGVEPGWQSKSYPCSFVWDKERFPDPDAFIAKMHALNYRLNFWEHAFTSPQSPMYAALKPWSGNFSAVGGLVPDFATAQGRRIFLKQNDASLFSKGIDGCKLDECDNETDSATPWSFPEASLFPSGLDGELMHSLFGILYQRTMLEPFQQKGLRTWGLVRDSHVLAAPLPYVVYTDSYDIRCYVRGLVNEGFTGLLWCPEVRNVDSVEELYRRIEISAFSPYAMFNCWEMKNPSWLQIDPKKNNRNELTPDHELVMANVRKLLELRMQLIPYLYSAFNDYHLNGTPPLRALVADWPQDSRVREVDDQFMFGPSLMVAPLFTGQKQRSIYLPAGSWFDFWTHQKYAGNQTIQISAEPEQIPVFVKNNTLLPLAKPLESIQPDTCFEMTVDIFGDAPADFVLYEDDGISNAFNDKMQNEIRLHWFHGEGSAQRTGKYSGASRYHILKWERFDDDISSAK